ncbi:MAG TPA: NUDIX domain-containing protein [Gemmatimonadaceae bacterium]|nr:NUDIX domain-containing protein [Gemmatimonadaceae bacterium]
MTVELRAGVVDVLALHRAHDEWQVLALQRAQGVRCTGAWEIVHGSMEAGETPEQAAVRELHEETGFAASRLYNVTVNPFYLHQTHTIQLAVVFAAVVTGDGAAPPTPELGVEHEAWAWLTVPEALERLAWPREHQALRYAVRLLATGDAGPVEDVLRVF